MATIKKFENDIRIMTDQEVENYGNALETLKTWALFEREFGHSNSLGLLRMIVSEESTRRLMKSALPNGNTQSA